ncbi:MAG: TolB family protein [Candidatus Flexifilum sp.]|jgi:Tol biopolymer transport system component
MPPFLRAIFTLGALLFTASAVVSAVGIALGTALPDRVLLFESTRSRAFDTYLLDAARGIVRPLLRAPALPDGCFQAAWSPDGRRVACRARGQRAVYLIDPLTGRIERIDGIAYEAGVAWSPDGTRLAYLIAGQQDGIGILDRASGTRAHLPAAGFSARPVWSPDGTQIAFGSTLEGLIVARGDGSARRAIGVRLNTIAPPVWLPDGGTILFQDGSPGSMQNLNRVDLRTGAVTPLTTGLYNGRPVLSPDGTRLAYIRLAETGAPDRYELVVRDLADGSTWVISRRVNTYTTPDWSADGAWIAFESWREGASGIYVVRADGTDERRVTISALDYLPRWRPRR